MVDTFTTFWGELDVPNTAPAEEPKEVDGNKTKVKEPKGDDKTIEEEDDKPGEGDGDKKRGEGFKDPKDPEEEEEEYEYTSEDVSKAYTMLQEEGVLEITEEDEFDSTPEGLADAIAVTVRNKMQKEIEDIPEVVQEFYSHVQKGGGVSDFTPSQSEIEWADFKPKTEETQKQVLSIYYKSLGYTQEEVDDEIQDVSDTDRIDKKTNMALKALSKSQALRRKSQEKDKLDAEEKATKSAVKEISEIKSTIDDWEEVAGFKLDDDRKEEFKSYLFDIDKRTGKTQMQLNVADKERRLRIAFLDFIDYNGEDVKKDISTKLTKTRKKKLSRYTDKKTINKNSSRSIASGKKRSGGKIQFPSIFGTQTVETK